MATGAEWWFYHVEHSSLESAVTPLLDKCLSRGWRVVVAGKDETLQRLDGVLWTWRDDSFLPHGRGRTHPERQPILLQNTADPVNGARVALLLDGSDVQADRFDRCLVVFSGEDEASRAKARMQFKAATDAGQTARYFQQEGAGGWKEFRKAGPDTPA